jgi:hypothetical protein
MTSHALTEKIDKTPSIKVPLWDPAHFFKEHLKEYKSFTAIIVGSRHSGKSNMLKYFLAGGPKSGALAKRFDMIIVFSKTLVNGHYQKFLKTKLLFKEFNAGIIEEMDRIFAERKKEGKSFSYLVIFDDMVGNNIKYSNDIESMFFNGRHTNSSVIYLSQKASMVSQNWKNNTDLFVVLPGASGKEKNYIAADLIANAIYDQMGIARDWFIIATAKKLLDTYVKDYNAIIITPFCSISKIKQFKAPMMKK